MRLVYEIKTEILFCCYCAKCITSSHGKARQGKKTRSPNIPKYETLKIKWIYRNYVVCYKLLCFNWLVVNVCSVEVCYGQLSNFSNLMRIIFTITEPRVHHFRCLCWAGKKGMLQSLCHCVCVCIALNLLLKIRKIFMLHHYTA